MPYQRLSETQAPNIRGALKCSTLKMLNGKRSSTQAPNVRGALQNSTLAVLNKRCSSTQAKNVRVYLLQCSHLAVPDETCNAAIRQFRMKHVVERKK